MEVAARRVAAWKLLWGGGSSVAWNQREVGTADVDGCHSWQVWGMEMLIGVWTLCILSAPMQLGPAGGSFQYPSSVSHRQKSHKNECGICVMLQIPPNISVMLE